MTGTDSPDTPLEAAAGAAGPQVTAAFKQLANETRVAILLALWEAYEPFESDDAVRFSVLRRRVGVRDKGQFHYHLDRLVGQFVRKTDEGYRLRNAGRKVARAVIAGAGFSEETLAPTEIDVECPYCGARTAIAYEDEWLFQVCTRCAGTFGDREDLLAGTLTVWPFDRAGLADRTPEEMFVAGAVATMEQYALMVAGVCPACSGTVDTSLDVCRAHEPPSDGVCTACDRRYAIQVEFVCTGCKNKMWGPPSIVGPLHPDVVTFYANRGVDLGYADADVAGVTRLLAVIRDHDGAELVSTDPPRVEVTFRCEGDEFGLVLDETLSTADAGG